MLQSSSANSAAVRNPPLELDVSTLPFPATLRHNSSRRYCTVTVTVTVTVTPRGLCHGLLSYCFSNPQATHSSPLIPPCPVLTPQKVPPSETAVRLSLRGQSATGQVTRLELNSIFGLFTVLVPYFPYGPDVYVTVLEHACLLIHIPYISPAFFLLLLPFGITQQQQSFLVPFSAAPLVQRSGR
jgi:hypothetical protein